MELEGRRKRQPFTKKKVLKILSSWHLWILPLPILWVQPHPIICLTNRANILARSFCVGAGGAGQPIFALYLKASKQPKYTITQINTYPTTVPAMQAAATLAYTWISDSVLRGRRWPIILWATVCNDVFFWDLVDSYTTLLLITGLIGHQLCRLHFSCCLGHPSWMALGLLYLDGSRRGNQPYYDGVSTIDLSLIFLEKNSCADIIQAGRMNSVLVIPRSAPWCLP